MINYRANLGTLRFDKTKFTKTLDRTISQLVREAVREWYRALWSLIPVETGMAKGALLPIAEELHNLPTSIRPTRKPYYSQLEGGIQERSFGSAKSVFELSGTDSGSFVYEFFWQTDVIHYYLETHYNGSAVHGKEALQVAQAAFQESLIDGIINRLPDVGEFFDFDDEIQQFGI